MKRYNPIVLIAQVSPISAILGLFLIVPIATILIVSFWDYSEFMLLPDFVWTNYTDTLGSYVTYKTYLNTFCKLANLPDSIDSFAPKAICKLAAPSFKDIDGTI